MQASGRLMASSTLVYGLFELTDQTIMIQYTNGDRGGGYQIFTKAGQLVAQELGIRARFKYGVDPSTSISFRLDYHPVIHGRK